MPIAADLLAILACPSADHAPLRWQQSGDPVSEELVCTVCSSRFPISDGIPVLLPDDAIPGPNGLGVAADAGPARDAQPSAAGAPADRTPG